MVKNTLKIQIRASAHWYVTIDSYSRGPGIKYPRLYGIIIGIVHHYSIFIFMYFMCSVKKL